MKLKRESTNKQLIPINPLIFFKLFFLLCNLKYSIILSLNLYTLRSSLNKNVIIINRIRKSITNYDSKIHLFLKYEKTIPTNQESPIKSKKGSFLLIFPKWVEKFQFTETFFHIVFRRKVQHTTHIYKDNKHLKKEWTRPQGHR